MRKHYRLETTISKLEQLPYSGIDLHQSVNDLEYNRTSLCNLHVAAEEVLALGKLMAVTLEHCDRELAVIDIVMEI